MTNFRPSMRRESSKNIKVRPTGGLDLRGLELQPDVDEVVRRPWTRVLERQLVEPPRDVFDLLVERLLLVSRDQERGVHDHLIANRLVDPRRPPHAAQLLER